MFDLFYATTPLIRIFPKFLNFPNKNVNIVCERKSATILFVMDLSLEVIITLSEWWWIGVRTTYLENFVYIRRRKYYDDDYNNDERASRLFY